MTADNVTPFPPMPEPLPVPPEMSAAGMTPDVWAGLTPMARDALQGIAAGPDDVTRLRQAVVAPLEIGWHHYLPSELLAMFAILSEAHESLSAFPRRAIGDGMYGGDE